MMPFRTDVGRLAAQLPDALLRIDDDGRVVWRNLEFRHVTEGDGPTLLGRPLRELAHPDDRPVIGAALTGLSDGATTAAVHIRARLAGGHWRPTDLFLRRTPTFETHAGFVSGLLRVAAS